jgi:hypothetical protein
MIYIRIKLKFFSLRNYRLNIIIVLIEEQTPFALVYCMYT